MIERPQYMKKIIPFIDSPLVKVLTGIRRSGKSTILLMLRQYIESQGISSENSILFYRLDSLEHEGLLSRSALYADIKKKLNASGKTYIFLDEIQEVEGWEKLVNSLAIDFDVDIYVTGSNSRMLSAEISTYLTGRYVSFTIYPLTFCEYLDFRQKYGEIGKPKEEIVRFIRFGGFPAVHLRSYEANEVYTIVKDIYNSTIYTDIVRRNDIRKVDQLERIVKYVFENLGHTFSASSIVKYVKSQGRTLDIETVYSYLSKLEHAYIVRRCLRYDVKGKEILKTQEKFYLADIALRHCVFGYQGEAIDQFIENVVHVELCARGFDVKVGKIGDGEVDFVASHGNKKIYVQVCYKIADKQTREREYGRLLSIKDNYPKYVVHMDDHIEGDNHGIHTIHLADFLLMENY